MVKPDETTPVAEDVWERLPGSLGEEWTFPGGAPLIGHFLGTQEVKSPKLVKPENPEGIARALEFALRSNPDEVVILWETADLRATFSDSDLVRQGDLVRITYLGERNFNDSKTNEPRRVKRYRVDAARVAHS